MCEIRYGLIERRSNFAHFRLSAGIRPVVSTGNRIGRLQGGAESLPASRTPRWSVAAGVAVSPRRLHCATCGCVCTMGRCHQIGARLSRKARQGALSAAIANPPQRMPGISAGNGPGRAPCPFGGISGRGETGARGICGRSEIRPSRRLRGRGSAGSTKARPAL